ncbi:MAG: hypothetical protein AAB336_00485 [Acidobacteriota bacterium]
MKRLLFVICLLALGANLTFAQQATRSYVGPTQNPKTAKKSAPKTKQTSSTTRSKGEIYVGYSGNVAPITAGGGFTGNEKKIHHGVQTSVTINANRYIGLRGDFSVGYRDQKEAFTVGGPITTVTRRTTIYNVLGGVQLKDNESEATIQPFGHALIGLGVYRQTLRDCRNPIGTFCGTVVRDSGLAGAVGGGFDVKVATRAGVRFTGDYNPMRIQKETINNFRFGVGVVFK